MLSTQILNGLVSYEWPFLRQSFFPYFFFYLFNFFLSYEFYPLRDSPLLNDVKYFELPKRHVNAENGQLLTVNTMFIHLNEFIWHLAFIKTPFNSIGEERERDKQSSKSMWHVVKSMEKTNTNNSVTMIKRRKMKHCTYIELQKSSLFFLRTKRSVAHYFVYSTCI